MPNALKNVGNRSFVVNSMKKDLMTSYFLIFMLVANSIDYCIMLFITSSSDYISNKDELVL